MPIEKFYGWTPSKPDFRDIIFASPRQVLESLPPAVDLSQPAIPAPWADPWNQSSIGSCGPHSSCADIVFAGMRQQGFAQFPMPSRLFVYWCTRYIMGTINSDSGVTNRDMLKALSRFGWCDESLWPYDISKFRNQPSQKCFDQAENRKIAQYQSIPQSLEQMKGCIAAGDPFIFGFSVYSSIDEADNTGIIPMPKRSDRLVGGHDVLICGYADGPNDLGIPPRHFKLRNSWDRWGRGGYGFIPYEYAANPQLAGDFWTVTHSAYVPVTPPAPPIPPPQPVPSPPGNSIMAQVLKVLDAALTMFERYAAQTPSTQDDAIAVVLRLILTLLQKWLDTGVKPTQAEVDACTAAISTKIASV